ncbi:MAG: hypothetical protein RLZZ244_2192 [Verrucomicrobiota bacterium]|jgi:cardiolipin synthase
MGMTLANKITLTRIGLIPVYVLFVVYYGKGFAAGHPQEGLRWAAVAAFALAALSDGLDGFIARRFNQRTELGVVLDPIADKGLLMSGILALSFANWGYELPLWFAVVVLARDAIVMVGALVLMVLHGKSSVRTTWTGKVATALQMVSLVAVMLQSEVLRRPVGAWGAHWGVLWLDVPVILAAFFTVTSGVTYSSRVIALLHLSGHGDPTPWPKSDPQDRGGGAWPPPGARN